MISRTYLEHQLNSQRQYRDTKSTKTLCKIVLLLRLLLLMLRLLRTTTITTMTTNATVNATATTTTTTTTTTTAIGADSMGRLPPRPKVVGAMPMPLSCHTGILLCCCCTQPKCIVKITNVTLHYESEKGALI